MAARGDRPQAGGRIAEPQRLSVLSFYAGRPPRTAREQNPTLLDILTQSGQFLMLFNKTEGEKHDYWNVYKFGEKYKIVYVNYGGKSKSREVIAQRRIDTDVRFLQSISRTKARIFELALCNEFRYFSTFTQDGHKRDRYDLVAFRKDFAQFVRNLNRARAEDRKIKYLIVPEKHKDGAWHFHGLLMGLDEKDLKKNEFGYLNWEKYSEKFGFFSVSPIKSHEACSSYITKYISKGFAETDISAGNHLFFASQGLKGAEVVIKEVQDKCPYDNWDFCNEWVKIKWVNELSE